MVVCHLVIGSSRLLYQVVGVKSIATASGICYNDIQQPQNIKTVNRKSRHGALSQRAGVGGSPVRVRCRSSPGSCKLKPARVVGDAGNLRRYKKGGIGFGPYS